MTSIINLTNLEILNNPTKFDQPFQFRITFECIDPGVKEEWRVIYVGSAEDDKLDQELDSFTIESLVPGTHQFEFETQNTPNPELIPIKDLLEVTVVMISGYYKSKEFIRVGYYVNNEYEDPELKENPPEVPKIKEITRNILETSPRYRIPWDQDIEMECEEIIENGINFNENNDEVDLNDIDDFKNEINEENDIIESEEEKDVEINLDDYKEIDNEYEEMMK